MTKFSASADNWSAASSAVRLDRLRNGVLRLSRRRMVRFVAVVALDFLAVMTTVALVFALAHRGQSQSPIDRLVFLVFFA